MTKKTKVEQEEQSESKRPKGEAGKGHPTGGRRYKEKAAPVNDLGSVEGERVDERQELGIQSQRSYHRFKMCGWI